MRNVGLLGCVGVLILVLLIGGVYFVSVRNNLVGLEEGVNQQWAQVESQYQRRADLIPNLVATVKGAADFEKSTLQAVVEARSRVGQVAAPGGPPGAASDITSNPQQMEQFAAAQQALSSALSRLLVVSENYPQLRANESFRDLQAQLEGTENRIAVERMRFNEVAREFNSERESFPTVLIAGFFGDRFDTKSYFQAEAGAERAPEVKF